MSNRYPLLASVVAILLAVSFTTGSHAAPIEGLPLEVLADVPLSGKTTRWDYASLDPGTHHLFIAHLGDSTVTVFDTRQQKVIADIAGVSHVHGVLFVPELDRVYATATGTGEVVAIDTKHLKVTARAPAGDYPDGMAYAPEKHKLYVSDEHGGVEAVIDTRTNERVATIALGGEVGNTQYDPVSKHIFANVQTRRQLVEIDPDTDRVIARTDLPEAEGNHGLYIDAASRLAFIACEGNSKLLVFSLASRRVLSSFDVAKGPDVLAFDTALGWLYVAGESGEVSLFRLQGQTVKPLGTATVGPNAHVVAIDPASHQAYFPLKALAGKPMLRMTQAQP